MLSKQIFAINHSGGEGRAGLRGGDGSDDGGGGGDGGDGGDGGYGGNFCKIYIYIVSNYFSVLIIKIVA